MYPVCIYIVQSVSVSRILNVSSVYIYSTGCICIVQGVSVSRILHVSSVYLYSTRVYLYPGYFMYPVCIYIVHGVSVSRILHVSSVYLHPEYGMYQNTAIPIFVNLEKNMSYVI